MRAPKESKSGPNYLSAVNIMQKEAQRLGLKKYYTGKPCKYGHVAGRRRLGKRIALGSDG